VEARSSWTTPQVTSLTYNDTEKFLHFIDKYVKQAVGNHNLSEWMKLNGSKTLLDRITQSNITYTIILYENSVNVWMEELVIKATSKTKEDRQSARRHQKQRYHHASGKCIKCYSDGWTNAGKEYYREWHSQYKTCKDSQLWTIPQGHWKTYQIKVYKKHYKQELREGNKQEEDVESSDEEDWLVHTDEAIGNMDHLGEEFGMVENGQFNEV
jgi:hypothetical protein